MAGTHRTTGLRRAAALLAAALAGAGCNSRPRAPALRPEAVYQNEQEGFRFLAPEGWDVFARTALPPGPVPKEKLLIGYRKPSQEPRPATFEVSCADLPESADLTAHQAGPATAPHPWRPNKPAEPLSVGDVPATRITLAQGSGPAALTREVVAVRRGGRVYFFSLTAAANDTASRDQARRAVASVVWRS